MSRGQSEGKNEQANSKDFACQCSDSFYFYSGSNGFPLLSSSFKVIINLISVEIQK